MTTLVARSFGSFSLRVPELFQCGPVNVSLTPLHLKTLHWRDFFPRQNKDTKLYKFLILFIIENNCWLDCAGWIVNQTVNRRMGCGTYKTFSGHTQLNQGTSPDTLVNRKHHVPGLSALKSKFLDTNSQVLTKFNKEIAVCISTSALNLPLRSPHEKTCLKKGSLLT